MTTLTLAAPLPADAGPDATGSGVTLRNVAVRVIADADIIAAWVRSAAAGDELHYAVDTLPPWAAGPKYLADLATAARGLVLLYQKRVDGVMHYFAVRTARAWLGNDRPVRGPVDDEAARIGSLIRERTMGDGWAVLTNREAAILCGIDTAKRVEHRLAAMVRAGVIVTDFNRRSGVRRIRWLGGAAGSAMA